MFQSCVSRKNNSMENEDSDCPRGDDFYHNESSDSDGEDVPNAEHFYVDENIELKKDFSVPDKVYEGKEIEIEPKEINRVCCERKCLEVGNSEELKAKFWRKSKVEQKNCLLQYLLTMADVKISTADDDHSSITYDGHEYCKSSFSEMSGISRYILNIVQEDFNSGRNVEYEHGNKGSTRLSAAAVNMLAWMKAFAGMYGQESPDEQIIILSKIFIMSELFQIYLKEIAGPHVKKSTFFQLFKMNFGPRRRNLMMPRIRISRHSSHSKCDMCVRLQDGRQKVKSEADLVKIRSLTEAHRQEYASARIEVNRQIHMSVVQSREWFGIQLDDMDNSKSMIPRLIQNPKSLAGMRKIKTKITGCIIVSSLYEQNRKCHFFTNHDQYENGSNKVVTVLFKLINMFKQDHGFLPTKLAIQTDNCARENKNQFVFAFLYSLVDMKIFEEVTLNFLHVGHTGFAVDQLFSILAAQFKKQEIRTIEDLHWLISSSNILPKATVEPLEYIFDWKSFIATQMSTQLQNHSFPKSFRFVRENNLTKMFYKALPQDELWLPKSGMKLLESNPRFRPVGAAPFRVSSLGLGGIEADLRKYLRMIPVDQVVKVQNSWESLRDRLESMERNIKVLPKMDLDELRQADRREVEDIFEFKDDEMEDREVKGDIYPENDGTVMVGDDVAVYTAEMQDRPWVGRVLEVEEKTINVHWFRKRSQRSYTYEADYGSNGSALIDQVDRSTILFIGISSTVKEHSFTITPRWANKIIAEYEEIDDRGFGNEAEKETEEERQGREGEANVHPSCSHSV